MDCEYHPSTAHQMCGRPAERVLSVWRPEFIPALFWHCGRHGRQVRQELERDGFSVLADLSVLRGAVFLEAAS